MIKIIGLKNLLFFWFLLSVFGELNSQNLNVAHHSYVDEASNLVSINSKYFYFEKVSSNLINDYANIVGLNDKGQIIFKTRISYDLPIKFIRTLDKELVFIGVSSGCDVSGPNALVKIDTNGNKILEFPELPLGAGYPGFIRDLVQHQDSSYYILSDSSVFHLSKNFQLVSKVFTGFWESRCMTQSNNGNFILNVLDTLMVHHMIEMNTSGALVKQQISGEYSMLLSHPTSADFYGLKGGKIEKINSSLLPVVNTSTTINSAIVVSSFVLKNDSIFFTGITNPDSKPVYGILNKDLIPLYITQSSYKKIYPTSITIDNRNRINILTNACSLLSARSFIFHEYAFTAFYQFPLTGSFSSTKDIGVESFSLISAVKSLQKNYPVINLKVKIRNYGVDTIRNFCLSSSSQLLFCGFLLFHKSYSVPIPPNSFVEVETGTLQSVTLGPASDSSAYIFSREICLYTSVPNQESDAEINNDGTCSRVLTSDTLVERIPPTGNDVFSIYPNPFDQTLTVESDVEIEELLIHNPLGQLVWQAQAVGKKFTIYDFNEPKGIYFIKLKTAENTVIKKVVKVL